MQTLEPLPQQAVARVVRQALDEDAPWGDLTSDTVIPADASIKASLVAREHGVLAGIQLFVAALRLTDPAIDIVTQHDAQPFFPGDILATAEGSARSILRAERVALNFVQHLSGIATLTAQFVEAIKGTSARIVDTRMTTPTLRIFERYAVRCGGGGNHRQSLSDGVLIHRDHLAVLAAQAIGAVRAGSVPAQTASTLITAALQQAREILPHTAHLEVEVEHLDQIEPVLAAGVDSILLDSFTPDGLRAVVEQVRQSKQITQPTARTLLEATGNVRLDTVRAIAETGVDLISVSALTQSVRSLDLGLEVDPRRSNPPHHAF